MYILLSTKSLLKIFILHFNLDNKTIRKQHNLENAAGLLLNMLYLCLSSPNFVIDDVLFCFGGSFYQLGIIMFVLQHTFVTSFIFCFVF